MVLLGTPLLNEFHLAKVDRKHVRSEVDCIGCGPEQSLHEYNVAGGRAELGKRQTHRQTGCFQSDPYRTD